MKKSNDDPLGDELEEHFRLIRNLLANIPNPKLEDLRFIHSFLANNTPLNTPARLALHRASVVRIWLGLHPESGDEPPPLAPDSDSRWRA